MGCLIPVLALLLWAENGTGWSEWLDSTFSKVFSNLNDSMKQHSPKTLPALRPRGTIPVSHWDAAVQMGDVGGWGGMSCVVSPLPMQQVPMGALILHQCSEDHEARASFEPSFAQAAPNWAWFAWQGGFCSVSCCTLGALSLYWLLWPWDCFGASQRRLQRSRGTASPLGCLCSLFVLAGLVLLQCWVICCFCLLLHCLCWRMGQRIAPCNHARCWDTHCPHPLHPSHGLAHGPGKRSQGHSETLCGQPSAGWIMGVVCISEFIFHS